MLRVIRNHKRAADGEAGAYESLSIAPTPLDHAELADAGPAWAGLSRSRPQRLGRRARARREARLPQRAGFGRRADRHDRPRDGLRHDRHRAGLRAGEVQEARRAAAISRSSTAPCPDALRALGYGEKAIEDMIAYAVGHATLPNAPGINHAALRAKGAAGGLDREGRGGAARRLRHPLRLQQMDARRRHPRATR